MLKNIFILCAFLLLANGQNLLVEITKHLEQLEHQLHHFYFNTTRLLQPKAMMNINACHCMRNFTKALLRMVNSVTCKPTTAESICKMIHEICSKLERNIEHLDHGRNPTKADCPLRNVISNDMPRNKTLIIHSYLKFIRNRNEVCQTDKRKRSAHF